jgi:hypothetical protein
MVELCEYVLMKRENRDIFTNHDNTIVTKSKIYLSTRKRCKRCMICFVILSEPLDRWENAIRHTKFDSA